MISGAVVAVGLAIVDIVKLVGPDCVGDLVC